ncbi:hypothetical protein ACSDR0_19285 [Streptosporangium sp. G11]|uniref:hypothetical protein n=1 Tax=Streptosporangium sp. G11 TaxID=3436926 RepID=UPI003EB91659
MRRWAPAAFAAAVVVAALIALGIATACLFFAQFVLFGGARQATTVDPLSLMRRTWGS